MRKVDPSAAAAFAEYEHWYETNDIESLLCDRISSKGQKNQQQPIEDAPARRGTGGRGRGSRGGRGGSRGGRGDSRGRGGRGARGRALGANTRGPGNDGMPVSKPFLTVLVN